MYLILELEVRQQRRGTHDLIDEMEDMIDIALWIVQGILGLAFLAAGGMKLVTPIAEMAAQMAWVNDVPELLVRFIGASEVAGALGLVLPAALRIQPRLTPIAASLLAVVMVLAAATHISLGELGHTAPNIGLGGMCAFVAWGRWKKVPVLPRVIAAAPKAARA